MSSGTACEDIAKKLASINTILPLKKKVPDDPTYKPGKVILLAGPTACGKSALSLMLAEALGGEIVSADSVQVYRGMDIGTAKISKEEQERIPHYLIDIRNIQEPFNVVDFYYEARKCIDSILARGKVPIVVGGSGFYFRALLYGPPSGPPSFHELRHSLENEMDQLGSEALYDRLKEHDPVYAASITARDKQKIIRGLEIVMLTGKKVSDIEWKRDKVIPDYTFHSWFLHRPREVLYPRIDLRCEEMLYKGLVDEVEALIPQGLLSNPSAAQAIGYRQCVEYLSTDQTPEDYADFVRKFKTASHHYAKRQFTWFRKEPLFRWVDVEIHDFEIVMDMIGQDFRR